MLSIMLYILTADAADVIKVRTPYFDIAHNQ